MSHDNSTDDASGADASSDDASSDDASNTDAQGTNWLEWAVFALGVAITLGVIGYLGVRIAIGSDKPADLHVTLQAPEVRGATVFVPVEVENRGDRVAEEAVIEVCAGPEACGQVSFTYVPQGSKRKGVVGLSAPLAEAPASRVVSHRTL